MNEVATNTGRFIETRYTRKKRASEKIAKGIFSCMTLAMVVALIAIIA